MLGLAGNLFFVSGCLGLVFGLPWCYSLDEITLMSTLISWLVVIASSFLIYRGIRIRKLRSDFRNKYLLRTALCAILCLAQFTFIGFVEFALTLIAIFVVSITPDEDFCEEI